MLLPQSLSLTPLLFIVTHLLFRECSFHHMPMHLAIWCVSHSYLTLLGFHHFIVHFIVSMFISSFHCSFHHMRMHLSICIFSHSYLNLLGFHRFIVHFIMSLFISSHSNALGHLVYLTLILNPSRVHHFIAYILGLLTFERILDL